MFRTGSAARRWVLILTVALAMLSPLTCGAVALAQDAPAKEAPAQNTPVQVAPVPEEPEADAKVDVLSALFLPTVYLVGLGIVSYGIGVYLSKAFRLPDHATRMAVIAYAVIGASLVTYMRWPPTLGIDLSGGTILVYEIDPAQKPENETPQALMDKLVAAITRRVNPDGLREVTVRPVGLSQIEIIIPESSRNIAADAKAADGKAPANAGGQNSEEELDRIKEILSKTGALEFAITANSRDHGSVVDRAKALSTVQTDLKGDEETIARWVPVKRGNEGLFGGSNYVTRTGADGRLQVLAIISPKDARVTGDDLANATTGRDNTGEHAVMFRFKSVGARKFYELTFANTNQGDHFRHLGIILDGELFTAPSIKSAISDSGEISGNFTEKEATKLAAVLTAGQLPAALYKEPRSEMTIGPTLGADTIRKGVTSMIAATSMVAIFMLVYYRFAGIVANVAVLLNVLLTVAFMMLFKAAFTLSGLAGLALTVGMAVDANVLIYERMREELAKGATLRMAIRNGFERAFTAIIDSNITTLIAALVLYFVGTDQVKGFAVALFIGIMMNLFTALTVSRCLFDIAERMGWVKQLKMMQILTKTNFDFVGKRYAAIALSLLVIGVGMAGVAARGRGLLDIDFTGGTSVETLFDTNKPQDIADVRAKVETRKDVLPDVTVQDVKISDEPRGIRFLIVTSNQDEKQVEAAVAELFKGQLAYNAMTIKDVKLVADASASSRRQLAASPGEPGENELALAFFQENPPSRPAEGEKKEEGKKEGDAKPADKKPEEGKKPEAKTADQEKPAETKPEDKKPADKKPEESKKPEDKKADEKKPATEKKPAEAKPAETKPASEAKKPDDVKKPDDAAKPAEAPVAKDPFAGGTRAEVSFAQGIGERRLTTLIQQRLAADPKLADTALRVESAGHVAGSSRGRTEWTVSLALPVEQSKKILEGVQQRLSDTPFFPASNKIGASVAAIAQRDAIRALLISMGLILVYVWFRFSQIMFGLSVLVALVHDVLVTLGAIALSYWVAPYLGFALVEPFKINLTVVSAFLTIIGYSLNDTIVIFDRIREIRGKSTELSPRLVNDAINQTLSRTILTSLTVFLVVVTLYLMGGQGIHGFAFAMVVGVISGTYSTIYVATPVLIWLNRSTPAGEGRLAAAKAPVHSA